MNSKLTLYLDKEVIEEAKKTARKNGLSLSKMIEHQLKAIPKKKKSESIALRYSGILNEAKLRRKRDKRINYLLDK